MQTIIDLCTLWYLQYRNQQCFEGSIIHGMKMNQVDFQELQLDGLPDWTRILRSAASVQQWLGQGQPETLGIGQRIPSRNCRENLQETPRL
jgi:hypothetical protein